MSIPAGGDSSDNYMMMVIPHQREPTGGVDGVAGIASQAVPEAGNSQSNHICVDAIPCQGKCCHNLEMHRNAKAWCVEQKGSLGKRDQDGVTWTVLKRYGA